MCESWSFFWMYLVTKTLKYVKEKNLNLTIEEWLPLIETYFTREVDVETIYNLLISFISQLYIEFNNENKDFNNHVKKLLRKIYLSPSHIKVHSFTKGIVIEDITGREIYELQQLKKQYKEYVNKLAILKEDFLKRQEAVKDIKNKISEEEERISLKQGKRLFENCSLGTECASKCCKSVKGFRNMCVPHTECRHLKNKK